MIDEIQKLLDQYLAWLRDKTTLRQVKDWIEITTPYLDRHNDYLQIYVKRENSGFIITDEGNLNSLLSSKVLRRICNRAAVLEKEITKSVLENKINYILLANKKKVPFPDMNLRVG